MNTGYLIINIAKKLKYQLNQVLQEQGITIQQWAVLQQLTKQAATMTELARKLDMDKPTVSGIVHRLTNKNLLTQAVNPKDSRSKLLQLTPSGREQVAVGQKLSDQVLQQQLEFLSAAEQAQLQQLLAKIDFKE